MCGRKRNMIITISILALLAACFVLQNTNLGYVVPKTQGAHASDLSVPQAASFTTAQFGISAGTDNTQEINNAIAFIASSGGGVLKFSDNATYLIDARTGVIMQSNVILDFSSGAKLKAIPNDSGSYSVVKIHNVKHVGLINPYVIGDKDQHTGTTGEWGMGIDIRNSQYVDVNHATIENCWGDGIYLGNTGKNDRNQYINFTGNTVIKNCRRQGISVISALNCYIENLYVEDVYGTAPGAAIDFEPNNDYETIENFVIGTIKAVRCRENVIFAYNSSKFEITIDNILAHDCANPRVTFSASQYNIDPGYINIGKIYINNPGKSPAIYKSHWFARLNPKVHVGSVVVD